MLNKKVFLKLENWSKILILFNYVIISNFLPRNGFRIFRIQLQTRLGMKYVIHRTQKSIEAFGLVSSDLHEF